MTWSGEFSVLVIDRWRLQYQDTSQWFMNIRLTATFLAKMAPLRIHWHSGVTQDRVHHLHNQQHIRLECHLLQLVTMQDLKVAKSKVCQLDMCIYILHFPTLSLAILMHIPRIASVTKFLFEICWLMRNIHLLVHDLLCGDVADNHCADERSLLSKPDSEDKHW